MADGYLKKYAKGRAEIYSAGIETHGVNPKAIKVMKEDGVDISGNLSNNVSEYRNIDFDYVITVCDNANEQCPVFPSSVKKIHHNFPDPAKATGSDEEVMQQFRIVRDQVKKFSEEFVKRLP